MIDYSILDPTKSTTDNITVRFDNGKYAGSIITYNPIFIDEDEQLRFGIKASDIFIDGSALNDKEKQAFFDIALAKDFIDIMKEVFYDLLKLYKDNIQYE